VTTSAALLLTATFGALFAPAPSQALGTGHWALARNQCLVPSAECLHDVPQAPAPEVIAEIRVHGNHITSDEEVLKIAGIAVGAPFVATTIADVTRRLKDANKFETIQVSKRFASIEDPSKISLVLIVNEGAVRIDLPDVPGGAPRIVKRSWYRNLMYMPILDGEDGYGFTYGVRVAYPGLVGDRSRLSAPLTLGGFKRAGLELDRAFLRGPFSRVEVGTVIQQRKNPAYQEDDDRTRLWARAERALGDLRLGGTAGWQRVSFGDLDDDLRTVAGEIVFDTRLDPVLPRNAVYGAASVERVFFDGGHATNRTRLDGRGYLGLFRQMVVVGRAVREDASEPLPPYLKSLLGGWSSLRGFAAGSFVGDTMVAGSLELRVPVSSPLSVGKLGVSVFVDSGTAYAKGERFKDQQLRTGIGGSVWITLTAFRMGLSVAHGRGADTRVNFGGGITF
jgi:outer membrane protein assembly factor BamA